MSWNPSRTFAECDALLTGSGCPFEVIHAAVDGKLLKVYRNVEGGLRAFWLKRVEKYRHREYLVFETERYTYAQTHRRVCDIANGLKQKFHIRNGDRVAIAMRNFPEWIMTFWALHLIAAVPVCVNVWLTDEAFQHCFIQTNCKLAIVDHERASKLVCMIDTINSKTDLAAVIVVRGHEAKNTDWRVFIRWERAFDMSRASSQLWASEPDAALEDDCIIFFTSGTTSLPKAVLSSCRSFMQNLQNLAYVGARDILRSGGELPLPGVASPSPPVQLGIAPLFHVAGCTSILMTATANGGKMILMRKWNTDEGIKLIEKEGITAFGGVPAVTMDLLRSPLAGSSLSKQIKRVTMGAAPMPPSMPGEMKRAFRNATFIQLYGLTETNLSATAISGQDQLARPLSCGLPVPICDVRIVDPSTGTTLKPGQIGEILIRGSNIMRCYYNDSEATEKAITSDGWFKTGDLGELDMEGFLYIKDRAKDMIIRGGENIHCVTLENALLSHPDILEAGAVGVPDDRLGELPVVVVTVDRESLVKGTVTEAGLIAWSRKTLPAIVVPVMVIIQDVPLERNASSKILKNKLRQVAKAEWTMRKENASLAKL